MTRREHENPEQEESEQEAQQEDAFAGQKRDGKTTHYRIGARILQNGEEYQAACLTDKTPSLQSRITSRTRRPYKFAGVQ
jgi:hypothetical protein